MNRKVTKLFLKEKSKMGKIKDYVKKHKDAVPYVIGATAGLFVLVTAATINAKSRAKNDDFKMLDCPSLDEGSFNYYTEYQGKGKSHGYHCGGITDVPVSDLGDIGDKLKQCDGIDENSKISFVFTDYTEK
jgi:hypothetical protein